MVGYPNRGQEAARGINALSGRMSFPPIRLLIYHHIQFILKLNDTSDIYLLK